MLIIIFIWLLLLALIAPTHSEACFYFALAAFLIAANSATQ